MNKIYELVYGLMAKIGIKSGQDKVLHALVGFIAGVLFSIISPLVGVIGVLILAIGKELYDLKIKKTEFDFFDMFSTIFGGVVGIMALMALYLLF